MDSPTFSSDNGVPQSADGSSDNEEQETATEFPEGSSSDSEEQETATVNKRQQQSFLESGASRIGCGEATRVLYAATLCSRYKGCMRKFVLGYYVV
jgi:hypothetical protein